MIKISVITVVYNGEKFIKEAIETVLKQNYKNIELIIIDGKSTDNTLKIIAGYKDKVDVLLSEKDKGIFYAMNKGIDLATGDVIVFHNVGDFYTSRNVFSKVAEVFKNKKIDSCYGDALFIDNKKSSKVVRVWRSGGYDQKKLVLGWMPQHQTFFARRNIYKRYGKFKPELSISADYEMMLRFFGKNKISTYYIPEFFVKLRIGGNSNKDFLTYFKSLRQDYISWIMNWPNKKVIPIFSAVNKKIHKIPQFFMRVKDK